MQKIVEVSQKQYESLFKIHCESLPQYDQMTRTCFFDEFKLSTRKYFVAVDGKDIPIGYIGLFDCIDDVNIIGIAVLESCQRKGVGSALLDVAKKWAVERGAKSLSLEVDETNLKAINFYKKMGFELTNIRKNYYNNNNDAYIMWMYL